MLLLLPALDKAVDVSARLPPVWPLGAVAWLSTTRCEASPPKVWVLAQAKARVAETRKPFVVSVVVGGVRSGGVCCYCIFCW